MEYEPTIPSRYMVGSTLGTVFYCSRKWLFIIVFDNKWLNLRILKIGEKVPTPNHNDYSKSNKWLSFIKRKAQEEKEVVVNKYRAHHGPIRALQRNPLFPKNFITAGFHEKNRILNLKIWFQVIGALSYGQKIFVEVLFNGCGLGNTGYFLKCL